MNPNWTHSLNYGIHAGLTLGMLGAVVYFRPFRWRLQLEFERDYFFHAAVGPFSVTVTW